MKPREAHYIAAMLLAKQLAAQSKPKAQSVRLWAWHMKQMLRSDINAISR